MSLDDQSSPATPIPALRRGRNRGVPTLVRWTCLLALLAIAVPGSGQDDGATGDSGVEARPNPLNLELMLADPAASRDVFQQVRAVRRQLAAGPGTVDHFEAAAQRLAELGAYTTAIEVLWFAERMQGDAARATAYQDQMRQWAQQATGAEAVVEEAEQFFMAGREQEAVQSLLRALEVNPLSERAHFRLADTWRTIYRAKYEDDLSIAPLEIRTRIFADAHTHYRLALEIDPLFYDAYYGLSELRGLFPENHDLLMRTQAWTQQALDYRGAVLPVLQAIETGTEGGEVMAQLGEAFETIGVMDYAVLAYHCAARIGGAGETAAARLEAIRAEHFSGQ